IVHILSGGRIDFHPRKRRILPASFSFCQISWRKWKGVVNRGGRVSIIIPPGPSIAEALRPRVRFRNVIWNRHWRLNGEIAGVGDGSSSFFSGFCSDQYHPKGCPCPIDRSGRSILQHRDTVYIIRVQHPGITLYPIDQHQGATLLADGSRSPDIEAGGLGGLTVKHPDIQVGNGSDQSLCYVRNWTVFEYF